MFKFKKTVRTYPKPPKGQGMKTLISVGSSRAYWDWWESLDMKQRDQFLKDQIQGVTHYE